MARSLSPVDSLEYLAFLLDQVPTHHTAAYRLQVVKDRLIYEIGTPGLPLETYDLLCGSLAVACSRINDELTGALHG